MIHPNEPPAAPDWVCEPKPCPVMWTADCRDAPTIPPNIELGTE